MPGKIQLPIADVWFEHSGCGLLVIDKRGKILRSNKYVSEKTGWLTFLVIGAPIEDFIQTKEWENALNNGEERTEIIEWERLLFYIHYKPIHQDGQIQGLMIVLWDMADLGDSGKSINYLYPGIHELGEIVDCIYDGIMVINPGGRIVYVNRSYERLTGIPVGDLLGKSLSDLVELGYYSESVALQVIPSGKKKTKMITTKTGKSLMVTATPVYVNGHLEKIISNIRDLSEVVLLKNELENAHALFQKYDRERKRMKGLLRGEPDVIAHSKVMQQTFQLAEQISQMDSTVLILGESGVGKEVVANYIHQVSQRSPFPFIKVNCGAIPGELLESELFGYERHAFTGANASGKKGLFELADKGTIFLDEIGELPLNLQVKLLRALQEKEIYRIGGETPISLHIRVIAATNQDLEKMVKNRQFREDLYYRLNVIPIRIPPLRERKEDILPLALHFFDRLQNKYEIKRNLSLEFIEKLQNYHWAGNVRELANEIERYVVLGEYEQQQRKQEIPDSEDLDSQLEGISLKERLEQFERKLIEQSLRKHGSYRKAAKFLMMDHTTLAKKLKKWSIQDKDK